MSLRVKVASYYKVKHNDKILIIAGLVAGMVGLAGMIGSSDRKHKTC